jgi:predicted HTH transcriptional regulator
MSERLIALVGDLRALPTENNWLEFKDSNADPKMIGERISAISNAARLEGQNSGYIIWGIRNVDKAIVGTSFDPDVEVVTGEPYPFYLAKRLNPDLALSFSKASVDGKNLIVLEIPAATVAPIEFQGVARIRIGSATPKLADYPDRLRALWVKLQPYAWEFGLAKQFATADEVISLLDYPSYFELMNLPLPDNRAGILDRLSSDRLIESDVGGRWNVTNLGAILFARDLLQFGGELARKALRFVAFSGTNRASRVTNRQDGQRGYASGFKGLVDFVTSLLPRNEEIGAALRIEQPLYPPLALRELVANALIHQDMTIKGAGPLIEVFRDRIEITNPGSPLVRPERFIDTPPQSRNEAMAALMRRLRICEEQGTGIDKVVAEVEFHQLPPPDFRAEENAMRVTLYAPRKFAEMSAEERVRACYQHAVLKWVSGDKMRNSSLRERLGVAEHNASQVSNIIKRAVDEGLIRYADPDHPKAGYIPGWA